AARIDRGAGTAWRIPGPRRLAGGRTRGGRRPARLGAGDRAAADGGVRADRARARDRAADGRGTVHGGDRGEARAVSAHRAGPHEGRLCQDRRALTAGARRARVLREPLGSFGDLTTLALGPAWEGSGHDRSAGALARVRREAGLPRTADLRRRPL